MKLTILFLFLGLTTFFNAQTVAEKIEQVIDLKPRSVVKYELRPRPNQLVLQTAFNNAVYSDKEQLRKLSSKEVLKVELIYTTYRKNETFDQHGLNRKRLESFFSAAPSSITQKGVEWVLWAQSGCTSPEEGQNYFHGVVVTYRDKPDPILAKVETDFIREVANGSIKSYAYDVYERRETARLESDSASERDPVIVLPKFPNGEMSRIQYFQNYLRFPAGMRGATTVDVQFLLDKEGKITKIIFPNSSGSNPYKDEVSHFIENMPAWIPGKMDGKPVECMVQFTAEFRTNGSVIPSPLEIFTTQAPPKKSKLPAFNYDQVKPVPEANQVTSVLTKMNFDQTLIVADVTGSMAPFNAQVIEFLAQQLKNKKDAPKQFVFFNDGDNQSDRTKKVGKVGGVYSIESRILDSVVEVMLLAMNKGYGGDLEENNIEAVLKGVQQFPTTKQVIMLADNFASPRDLSLIEQVTVPIHVIACGGKVLNADYLNLAYKTKGSVSFGGVVYTSFLNYEEGATVQVGPVTFVLKKDKFVIKR